MHRVFSSFVMVLLAVIFLSCGGSTTGTGGITFSGVVQDDSGKLLSNVAITVSGGSGVVLSSADGSFEIYVEEAPSASYELSFTSADVVASVTIPNVPPETKEVTGVYTLSDAATTVVPSNISFESHAQSHDYSPTPTSSGSEHADESPAMSTPAAAATPPPAPPTESTQEVESETHLPESNSSGESDAEQEGTDEVIPEAPTETDTPAPEEEEVDGEKRVETGVITSLTSTSLVVNGVSFNVTHETEWKDQNEEDTSSSNFAVGDKVTVKGEFSHGLLVAHEVRKR